MKRKQLSEAEKAKNILLGKTCSTCAVHSCRGTHITCGSWTRYLEDIFLGIDMAIKEIEEQTEVLNKLSEDIADFNAPVVTDKPYHRQKPWERRKYF